MKTTGQDQKNAGPAKRKAKPKSWKTPVRIEM